MDELSDEQVIALLRGAARREPAPQAGDLWPRVHRRIQHRRGRFERLDWLLVAALALICLLRPALARILLFHF
jgi:hypothetical protein